MLNQIIKYALTHRLLILGLSLLIAIAGVLSLKSLPVDVFPDLNKPTVTVLTESHGLAPEEVETLVTIPIENALNGLPGLERIRSSSGIGLSVVYLQFEWGTDIYRNRQLVSEKLALARAHLPKDLIPVMGPVSSIMGQIQFISISSEKGKVTPVDLRTVAEWTVRPRLLSIPGVAQVISIGGGLKQYQILISAEKMQRYQLSMEDFDHEISHISQNTTGGFLDSEGQEVLIRNIGMVGSIEDIENTVVGQHFGKPVLVKDLAQVREGARIRRGDGGHNGDLAVIMSIQKQPGTDSLRITQDVTRVIEEMRSSLPEGVKIDPHVFKQSNFIQASIDGILGKLHYGSVLIFLILLLFLANFRVTAITLTAIPLSFLVTMIVFRYFDLTLNTMTLGGLAIAIGELVDDAIVDIENVFRRLRENSLSSKPKPKLKVIYEASSEVRNSIVIATVIIALVFVPLLNLTGLEGQLFPPLAIAYLTALASSLIISLTVTPVLASFLIKENKLKAHEDTKFVTYLKGVNEKVVKWALKYPKPIMGVVAVAIVAAFSVIPLMGKDFLPQFNEGSALVSVIARPGISLEESIKIGRKAEILISKTAEVKSVIRRTGRAELDEHAEGVNMNELSLEFTDDTFRGREEILNEIRENLSEIEDVSFNVGQPISHMIDHMLSGTPAQIAIKLFGPELSTLRQVAAEITGAAKAVPGLVDVRLEQQTLVPQLKVFVLREEVAKYNMSVGEVTALLESAFNGEIVAQVIEDQKIFDIFYRFDEGSRANPETIKETILKVMPDGKKVRLFEVADVYQTSGPNQVNRESGQRRIIVSANVTGRSLSEAVEEIKRNIQTEVEIPEGYYVIYGGQFKSQESATRKILFFGLLAILAIAAVLYSHFRSKMIVLQVMLTIPFALIGGLVLVFLFDRTLSVANLIGFITLCGIASRNGIMMISHFVHLVKHEGKRFDEAMIVQGAQERLAPILMTALTAAVGLLPLVFAQGEPGSEILFPVALVIVGGLVSSTILNLVVTPTLFYHFCRDSVEALKNKKVEPSVL